MVCVTVCRVGPDSQSHSSAGILELSMAMIKARKRQQKDVSGQNATQALPEVTPAAAAGTPSQVCAQVTRHARCKRSHRGQPDWTCVIVSVHSYVVLVVKCLYFRRALPPHFVCITQQAQMPLLQDSNGASENGSHSVEVEV